MKQIQTALTALCLVLGLAVWLIFGSQLDAIILLLLAVILKPAAEPEQEKEHEQVSAIGYNPALRGK